MVALWEISNVKLRNLWKIIRRNVEYPKKYNLSFYSVNIHICIYKIFVRKYELKQNEQDYFLIKSNLDG